MRENKYDNHDFFTKYSAMARSVDGLKAAGEWPAFRALLPDLNGKKVLDLGCGFGWHCRYAREQHARSVVGADISENMLERARAATDDEAIEYLRLAIEDIRFAEAEFDVVISSLAFHYIERFDQVCKEVHRCLTPGGTFVFSVEHPIFTALAAQDWHYGPQGERQHWPVDHYQDEGPRLARFLDTDVVKYHRTLATHLNILTESGFSIRNISEPGPTEEMLAAIPEMKDETRRPMFLLVSAIRD
ncbi:class I SAM-dependent methyltransferase [Paenibacillus thalictri]|uniref:Class I SAM-dependent methyltransferase n=1 Tax=Paenibacillus thalictri TaxID=2527873 RepID=A0A4Q9DPI2_9BACL|nr:class I SAM-dependent methyltransferase [Paenibacillus thalictri]TBL78190.1 class I SAM-dependent methyltransferase [Paenibacillus thalictri]